MGELRITSLKIENNRLVIEILNESNQVNREIRTFEISASDIWDSTFGADEAEQVKRNSNQGE